MAVTKVVNIKVKKTGDNVVKDLNKNLKTTNKEVESVNSSLDRLTGGAVSRFNGLKGGIKSAITSFKSLRVAIIATGLGALVVAVLAVKQAFTDSEEGQNKFAKLMGVIGSVTGNFVDLLAGLGEKIIEVFENPKKALNSFVELLKNNVINRFEGLLNLIPSIGKAISQLFEGDFSGAAETAANSVGKILLGVEDVVGATENLIKVTKEYGKELEKDARSAAVIADKRAKADKIERGLIVERALAVNKIAELREKAANKDAFTSKERIAFLTEAGRISEDITDKEITAAKLRRDAKIAENQLNKSNKQDLTDEENAKARVIQLDTQRLNLQKRLTAELVAASREKEVVEDKEGIERQEELQKVKDDFAKKIEDQEADTELKKIDLEQQRALDELDRLKSTEQDKLDVIKFFDAQRLKATEETNDKDKKSDEDLQDGKQKLIKNSLSLLGKASEESKEIQAAQALANTWQGVTEVWSAKSILPEPIATANKVVSTGVVLASGLNAVSNISKTASSSASVPTATAPTFNLSSPETNQIASTISTTNDKPVQAFVVGSAVTSSQELDRNKLDEGSIG